MLKIIQKNQRISVGLWLSLYNWRLTHMLNTCCSLSYSNRTFIRYLIATLLATIGLLCGIVPEFSSKSSRLAFTPYAYTQDFNDTQITKYAEAVLLMESYRLQAYRDIQQIVGQNPPNIVCNQPYTMTDLPQEAQKIAANYCTTSKNIVENSGLSVSQFNAITVRVQSDRVLERRIQNAMIRIRQQQQPKAQ